MQIQRPKYLNELIAKDGNGQVKVVTGIRRCGKSFLLNTLFKEHLMATGVSKENIIEMAFDKYSNKKFRKAEEFYAWVTSKLQSASGKRYVMLDEIQLLEDFTEILIDLRDMEGVEVYVTGSNAKLLSKDIHTEFRGRGDEIALRPLSFSEFMPVCNCDKYEAFESYAVYGGMPATVDMQAEEKVRYLKNLFSEIYINDIVERNGFRNVGDLEGLLDVLSSGIGSLSNPKRIADTFKSAKGGTAPSEDAIRNYIEAFKDSFVIEEAKRYDIKGRKYISSPYKYYFTDMGLRNSRMNFRQLEQTHAMENIIYNELRGRGFDVDVGIVYARKKNAEGKLARTTLEVDFVCNKGSKRYYIQSAYALPTEEKVKQEQASLKKIDDSFKKVIIVHDPIPAHYTDDGILYMNVFDFLLNSESLDFM